MNNLDKKIKQLNITFIALILVNCYFILFNNIIITFTNKYALLCYSTGLLTIILMSLLIVSKKAIFSYILMAISALISVYFFYAVFISYGTFIDIKSGNMLVFAVFYGLFTFYLIDVCRSLNKITSNISLGKKLYLSLGIICSLTLFIISSSTLYKIIDERILHADSNKIKSGFEENVGKITREDAKKILLDYCKPFLKEGYRINSSVRLDIFNEKNKYYCFQLDFGDFNGDEFYVDSTTGDIYPGLLQIDKTVPHLDKQAESLEKYAGTYNYDKNTTAHIILCKKDYILLVVTKNNPGRTAVDQFSIYLHNGIGEINPKHLISNEYRGSVKLEHDKVTLDVTLIRSNLGAAACSGKMEFYIKTKK